MFVLLCPFEIRNKSILDKIKNLIKKPRYNLEKRELLGADFYVLEMPYIKTLNWELIKTVCGPYFKNLLLPGHIKAPDTIGYTAPKFTKLKTKVLFDTACKIVQNTRMPMYQRKLGLIDMDANFSYSLFKLLRYFTSVTVVTARKDHYIEIADLAMETLGAPVIVSQSLSALSESMLVLSPGAFKATENTVIKAAVISGEEFKISPMPNVIDSFVYKAPGFMEEYTSMGFSETDLLEALFEYSDNFVLDIECESLCFNNARSSIIEISQKIQKNTAEIYA